MINDIIKKVREIEKKCKTEVEEKMNNNSKNPNVNVIKKLKNKWTRWFHPRNVKDLFKHDQVCNEYAWKRVNDSFLEPKTQ